MTLVDTMIRLLLHLLRFIYRFRYRFEPQFATDVLPEMFPTGPLGYADKLFYLPGEEISLYIRSTGKTKLSVQSIAGPYDYQEHKTYIFIGRAQEDNEDVVKNGCGWTKVFGFVNDLDMGYYRIVISDESLKESTITFICGGDIQGREVVVIAPVSTWVAYNPYGGKSAYKNVVDDKNVHHLSTLRPNTALQYKEIDNLHDVNVEANVFNWVRGHCQASIYPDTYLETEPEVFANCKIMILAYHCEYVTPSSYKNLMTLVNDRKKSLISLGGNQLYWKVRWNKGLTRMEVRKDATWFDGSLVRGGLYRHTLNPEGNLLGAQFTDPGTGTYAPYELIDAKHWLFAGLNLKEGQLFGFRGINRLPICGDETDKVYQARGKDVQILARGRNVGRSGHLMVYDGQDDVWDGKGGGEIVLRQVSEDNAVLSTGSIQSGSGLGVDEVFTRLIENFISRYSKHSD